MAEAAVSASLVLVAEVLHFLNRPNHQDLRKKVEGFKTSLRRMLAYLRDMEGKEVTAVLEERVREVRDVAYDIEDVLDESMLYIQDQLHPNKLARAAKKSMQWFQWRQYSRISSKMDDVKEKIKNIKELDLLTPVSFNVLDQGSTSSGSRGRHDVMHDLLADEEIVGFKNPLQQLSNHLVHHVELRQVTISVVGSGGSGKTVLVNNVYKSKDVRRRFGCHAWVHVTRSFDAEKLLDNMLQQFCSSREEQIPQSHQGVDICEKLRNYLQTKRYIVVLDDIWSEEQWNSIKNAFPKNFCGSRIIVTTRNSAVASSCVESPRCILELAALPRPYAWILFRKKAFNGGECPPILKDCAEKILKKCEGLPIAIVAVAGLLSRKPPLEKEWQKLHDSLGSEIRSHSVLSKILVPSYKDLTSNLRKCFLYFSNFPEDYAIGPGRLIRLWVAERFAEKGSDKTAEEVAEEYLKELIQRNLVHLVRSDFDGQVKRCRVQKLVLEFIVQKSEEENFVSVLAEKRKIPGENVRRLSVHDNSPALSNEINFSSVRSFFDSRPSPSIERNILSEFKLLRVLDMQGVAIDEFPQGIFLLTLLRYLSLRKTGIKTVPKSIKKLTFLETLDLRQTKVTELPAKIVRLVHLRHLFVYSYNVGSFVAFDSVTGVKVSEGIGALTNLQKLSVVKVDKYGKIIKGLGGLTQLRKLGLLKLKRDDGVNLCKSIQNMPNLTTLDVSSTSKDEFLDLEKMPQCPKHLRSLYLKGRLERVPGWIPSLHNLFRIGLMWSRLESCPLGYLQDLPNLMELQMIDAFCGPQLVFEAGRFKKLKILYIGQSDELCGVLIEEGAMPELQKLTLSNCKKLETLPWGINNLACVVQLLLYQMPMEFIAQLKSEEGKEMVSHIPVIHSFTVRDGSYWSLENLS